MCKLPFFIYLIVLNYTVNADELISVVAVFRHGDRTPIKPYPTDPYRNQSYWPVGFGQLTNTGKMQHFQLGKWLRTRYGAFLADKYSETEVFVRSSDMDRTLMSAEANLAGLYPPHADQIWNGDILWQPIPIHTTPELEDALVAMKRPCRKYTRLLDELFESAYFQHISEQNQALYAYLTRNSGAKIDSLEQLEYLYNTMFIEQLYNYTLPQWALAVYPKKMQKWAEMSFATQTYTEELARLKTGVWFNEIVKHFSNATVGGARAKMLMFSAHDTTIANLLNAMNVFSYHCPSYASTILMELHKSIAGHYYVNLLYKSGDNLELLTPLNCSQFNCELNEFIERVDAVRTTMEQWQAECEESWWMFSQIEHNFILFLIFIVVCALSLMVFLILMVKICFKANASDYVKIGGVYTKLPSDECA